MLQSRNQNMMQQSYLGKRFEFKYFLSPIEAAKIESYLVDKIKLTPDDNSSGGGYFVNSLYFDTPQMNDYRDKDGSFHTRKKVRARMYGAYWHDELDAVWLEVKHKKNMNIAKSRVRISGSLWNEFMRNNTALSLLNTDESFTQETRADLESFAHTHIRGNYQPMSVVRYKRKAYLAQFTSPVRITFDSDIRTCRAGDDHAHSLLIPVSHNAVIMEVKFNNKLPWWFDDMLRRFDIRRTDFSKYRNSVAIMKGQQRIPIHK